MEGCEWAVWVLVYVCVCSQTNGALEEQIPLEALLNKLMWRVTLHSVFTLLYLHYIIFLNVALHYIVPPQPFLHTRVLWDEICTLPEWQQKALLWSSVDTVIKKKRFKRVSFLFLNIFFLLYDFTALWGSVWHKITVPHMTRYIHVHNKTNKNVLAWQVKWILFSLWVDACLMLFLVPPVDGSLSLDLAVKEMGYSIKGKRLNEKGYIEEAI